MNHSAAAVLDLEPAQSDFLEEVLRGLSQRPRTLPCKFFYDARGAALFQKICELPEYYITRTETAILRLHAHEMAQCFGARCELLGLGTGAGTKTRILLEELREPSVYIPIDISVKQLEKSAALFRRTFPHLEILPVCADYLQPFELPKSRSEPARKIVYFPGSTIGNFEPQQAGEFLRRIVDLSGTGGGLLIGVDLKKDPEIIERAYNDRTGITAEFNLNLLVRADRELGANFDIAQWRHNAIYNSEEGRIEMYLVSEIDQTVAIQDRHFHFDAGEKILTEYSYKHSREGFIALAKSVGFSFEHLWTDDAQLFGLFYFSVAR
ncbi:MAG: hypothetical protein QOI04_1852 [Verrucomicrobiota bacterium]|jgi:dimethylhistidine N-methyltransferase